jgi:hypothetical protein
MTIESPVWKIVAASVAGPAHVESGRPCEDAYRVSEVDGCLVAVVCDGAGSASRGGHGAQHAVEAISGALRGHVAVAGVPCCEGDWNSIRKAVVDAIEAARATVLDGLGEEFGLKDCYATVVGGVIAGDRGMFFHIGDGYALALTYPELETLAISSPENGEYADTTYFYTQEHWEQHLRFSDFEGALSLVTFMSDGTSDFAIARDRVSVDKSFFGPVTTYLSSIDIDENLGCSKLMASLSCRGAAQVSSDDKTLIWAFRSRDMGRSDQDLSRD